MDSGGEVNIMTPAFVAKLGLRPRPTDVGVQKIDGLPLEIHGMASAWLSLQDSLKRVQIFEKTFLLTDTRMDVVLGMPFLSLSNANVEFAELEKFT